MLKAFNPVVILLISFAFRLQDPNKRLVGVVAVSSRAGRPESLESPRTRKLTGLRCWIS